MGKAINKQAKNKAPTPTYPYFYYLIFSLLILLVYGRSISYEFTLDDELFIGNNPTVREGISSIFSTFAQGSMEHFRGSNFQIYRPGFISLLCIEFSLFGLQPGGYHFINIVLYILTAIVLYRLMQRLIPNIHSHYLAGMVLLFIVHPVHAEVVASAKSQDELFAALFNLTSLYLFHRALSGDKTNRRDLLYSTLAYLGGLFCKESSVAFVAVFPLLLLLNGFREPRKTLTAWLPLVVVALFFMGIRHLAIGDIKQDLETTKIENILYGTSNTMEVTATKAGILWYFLRMMIYPHPLAWDYSFNQIPVMDWSDLTPWLSVIAYLLIGVAIVLNLKKQPVISFGLLFFLLLITPTSSLFFPNGTTFADRFLFLPSAGFISAAVLFCCRAGRIEMMTKPSQKEQWYYYLIGIAIVTGAVMSYNRGGDWKDNLAVFRSGAENAPNSSRTNSGLGSLYMTMAEKEMNFQTRNALIDSAVIYLERSIAIFPENSNARYRLGLIHAIKGDTADALMQYRLSIQYRPNVLALNNLGALYASMNQTDSAYTCFRRSLELEPANEMTLTNLCIVSNLLNRTDEAISTGDKAISLGMGNKKIYSVMANAYEKRGIPEKTAYYLQLYNTATR